MINAETQMDFFILFLFLFFILFFCLNKKKKFKTNQSRAATCKWGPQTV